MILIAVGYIALYFCIKFHFNKQHEFLVPQLWFLWFLALGFVSPIYFFLRNEPSSLMIYDLGDLNVHKEALFLIYYSAVFFFIGVIISSKFKFKIPRVSFSRRGISLLIYILISLKLIFIIKGFSGSLVGLNNEMRFSFISRFFVLIPLLILVIYDEYSDRKVYLLILIVILISLLAGDRRDIIKYSLLIYCLMNFKGYKLNIKKLFAFTSFILFLGLIGTFYGYSLQNNSSFFEELYSSKDLFWLIPDAFFGWAGQYYIVTGALDINYFTGSLSSLTGPFTFLFNNNDYINLKSIENMLFYQTTRYNFASSILTLPMQAAFYIENGFILVLFGSFIKGIFFGILLSLSLNYSKFILGPLLAFNSIHISQSLLISSRSFLIILVISILILFLKKLSKAK